MLTKIASLFQRNRDLTDDQFSTRVVEGAHPHGRKTTRHQFFTVEPVGNSQAQAKHVHHRHGSADGGGDGGDIGDSGSNDSGSSDSGGDSGSSCSSGCSSGCGG